MAVLYLVPSLLSDSDWQVALPAGIVPVLTETKYFIVENVRTARRFMKLVDKNIIIDSLNFYELNKHTDPVEIAGFLKPALDGYDMAVISEAGCPGVADPGADVVLIAHKKGIRVVPLSGPSSVIMALMASGLSGQSFAFNGYLPVNKNERTKTIANIEERAVKQQQTQIFIETPYRNNQLIKSLLDKCKPSTLLCIAANLTGNNEFIATKTIEQWKRNIPDLNKQPAVFLLGTQP
jgi:16S rRNA (cytidine1402-2'-O)-methyltransferase